MSAGSAPGLLIGGQRSTGQDVRTQNVTAVMSIANIVKSSLGPVGLDKARESRCFFFRARVLPVFRPCLPLFFVILFEYVGMLLVMAIIPAKAYPSIGGTRDVYQVAASRNLCGTSGPHGFQCRFSFELLQIYSDYGAFLRCFSAGY